MDAKLTLKLDKKVIELAKKYARAQGMSLSRYIEEFLRRRVQSEYHGLTDGDGILPEIREMTSEFDNTGARELTEDFDYRKAIGEKLGKKDT